MLGWSAVRAYYADKLLNKEASSAKTEAGANKAEEVLKKLAFRKNGETINPFLPLIEK